VELSRVNGMTKKKRKKQKGKTATPFQAFAVTLHRMFPKARISLKLAKTIWRNKQLRALFLRLMLMRALSPRKASRTKRKTKKAKKTKRGKAARKPSKRKKKKSASKGKVRVSFIAKSGPNKGKRVSFLAKR